MTDEQIAAEIAIQDEIISKCNVAILRLIDTKSTYNMSTGQTQLMVVERRIEELKKLKQDAVSERDRLDGLLYGGSTIQVRPFA